MAVTKPKEAPKEEVDNTPKEVVIDDSGAVTVTDLEDFTDDYESDEDSGWSSDGDIGEAGDGVNGEQRADSYMPKDAGIIKESFAEDDVPVEEAQNRFAPLCDASRLNFMRNRAERLAKELEKQDKKAKDLSFVRQEFTPDRWDKPEEIYNVLVERVLGKLGSNLEDEKVWDFLEEPANRLDLAVLQLVSQVGPRGVHAVTEQRMGTSLLFALTSDLDWMTGLMYSGPTEKLDRVLLYLAKIYSRFSEDMADPVARRIATTAALEFGGNNWGEKELIDRYLYYYGSYKEKKLNVLFNDLRYWETRFVTGCGKPGQSGWGSVRSMTWQRDNVRLPVEGYCGAAYQLEYRLRSIAGDSVFSGDYLAPVLKYTNNTTAWAHREIGGVCGALSHYGAYAALAAGLPAMPMGEPGHCAYTVRVNGEWMRCNSIYWQHGLDKSFWKEYAWDFLILTQNVYDDHYKTLVSSQLMAMGDVLASRRKMLAASRAYEDAVGAQPLNWGAWRRYLGYMKEKAPRDAEKWKEAHNRVVETLAVKYHHAAATLLSKYVYPTLFENVKDRKVLNKLFAAFFEKCETFGNNRWDVTELLNTQMSSCTTKEEKFKYMKEALKTLMSKRDYAGAVLSWGLDFIATLKGDDPETIAMQDEFTELVIKTMSKARTTKKEIDTTWAALGEAICTAADNGDRKTFQAIGKLSYRKCKKFFPNNKYKFRPIPGKIVSQTGLLTTKTELSGAPAQRACLHWGVLQRHGGAMPCKFGGQGDHIKIELEQECEINGAVAIFKAVVKNDRDYVLDVSTDGQNWTTVGRVRAAGPMVRLDCRKMKKTGRFVRLWRDGDKYEPEIEAFYIYGRPVRNK